MSIVTEKTGNLLKLITILSVVVIHTLTRFSFTPHSLNAVFYFGLNQLARFSVPLFVALSGYGLAVKYQNQKFTLTSFLKRRVLKLIPLYLIWVFTTLIIFYFIPQWANPNHFPLIEQIVYGKADYHFYFIPMIVSLYLLFPLLLPLIKRFPLKTLIATFILQALIYLAITYIPNNPHVWKYLRDDQRQYLLLLSWIFYFTLGMFLSLYHRFPQKLQKYLKYTSLALIIFGGIFSIIDSLNLFYKINEIITSTRTTRIPIMVYSTGVITLSILSENIIYKLPNFIKNTLSKLGEFSYLIFLSHTLILRLFFSVFYKELTPEKNLLTAALILFSITLSLPLIRLRQTTK